MLRLLSTPFISCFSFSLCLQTGCPFTYESGIIPPAFLEIHDLSSHDCPIVVDLVATQSVFHLYISYIDNSTDTKQQEITIKYSLKHMRYCLCQHLQNQSPKIDVSCSLASILITILQAFTCNRLFCFITEDGSDTRKIKTQDDSIFTPRQSITKNRKEVIMLVFVLFYSINYFENTPKMATPFSEKTLLIISKMC